MASGLFGVDLLYFVFDAVRQTVERLATPSVMSVQIGPASFECVFSEFGHYW